MTRGRELLGLPVVELGSGRQVGVVEDLLLDLNQSILKGLLVKSGAWIEGCRELSCDCIHQMGPDAVTFNAETIDDKETGDSGDMALKIKDLKGQRVIDIQGKELGTLEDVEMDSASGKLINWEISDGIIQDLIEGRKYLPLGAVVTYGEDRIIVWEGVGTG